MCPCPSRRHYFPVLLALLAFFFTGALFAGQISDELKKAMSSSGGDIPVIVSFNSRDPEALSVLNDTASSRQARIEALQRNAAASRANFLERFSAVVKSDEVRRFWIINGVALSTNAANIRAMAEHPDVRKIDLDATVTLPPVDVKDGVERGEWTYGLEKLKIPQVRQVFGIYGDGVTVGILDTGVDASHPDLAGKVVGFKDFVNGKTEAYDDQGHGTHCCGTIAGGNASGINIGVAPHAKIIMAKVFSSSGSAQSSWLLGGMQFMADPDGDPATDDAPALVSNSWGGPGGTTTYLEAVKNWIALGIFPNFAAGNSGPGVGTVGTPGGYLESFAVGATNSSDGIAYFSSRGPVTWDGVQYIKPDVSAPGYDIYSAKPGGGYQKMSGTSMACPHVSGLIALIYSANPGISIDEVRELLESTAKDLGEGGKDNTFGAGRVDALAALQIAVSGGRLSGRLIDSDTGAPLAGEVTIIEKSLTLNSNPEDGSFLTTLPEGDYSVKARAFGYRESDPVTVAIVAGEDTQMEIRLDKAVSGTISGTIKAADSGVSVKATVRVLDTPLAPVDASDGTFRLQLPAGSYRLMITAFGYSVFFSGEIRVMENSEVSFEAALEPLPPILLVDDDKGKSYETYYKAALDALGKRYDVVDVKASGQLQLDDILGYETLVWFTGDDYQSTLTSKDQAILKQYLEQGGRLLLSGQDVGYDLKNEDFFSSVLKARFVEDAADSRLISGQGLSFSIQGGTGAGNQKYPDVVEAVGGSKVYFSYEESRQGAAGIGADGVLYLCFGIEGVDTAENRRALVAFAFSTIEPTDMQSVARLRLLKNPEQRLRWAEVMIHRIERMSREQLLKVKDLLDTAGPSGRDLLRAVQSRLRD